jgi:hypothetical protein
MTERERLKGEHCMTHACETRAHTLDLHTLGYIASIIQLVDTAVKATDLACTEAPKTKISAEMVDPQSPPPRATRIFA